MLSAAKHLAADRDRPFASLRVTLGDCSNCQGLFFTLEPCLKVDARWMQTIASTPPKAVKSYFASFRKFFQWMGETGRVSPETVADVLTTLKDGRDHFLERVAEF